MNASDRRHRRELIIAAQCLVKCALSARRASHVWRSEGDAAFYEGMQDGYLHSAKLVGKLIREAKQ